MSSNFGCLYGKRIFVICYDFSRNEFFFFALKGALTKRVLTKLLLTKRVFLFVNSERLTFYRFSKIWNFCGIWRKYPRFFKTCSFVCFWIKTPTFHSLRSKCTTSSTHFSFCRQDFDWKLKRIQWHVFFFVENDLKHSKTTQNTYKTVDKIKKKHLKLLIQFFTSAGTRLHLAHSRGCP